MGKTATTSQDMLILMGQKKTRVEQTTYKSEGRAGGSFLSFFLFYLFFIFYFELVALPVNVLEYT